MPKIIIYSNDADFCSDLKKLLSGFIQKNDVHTSDSNTIIYDYINIEKPDLLFIDLRHLTPETKETVTKLKSKSLCTSFPTIFAYERESDLEHIETIIELGKDEIILYPFNRLEFKTRLNASLSCMNCKPRPGKSNGSFNLEEAFTENEIIQQARLTSANINKLKYDDSENYLWRIASIVNHIPTSIFIANKNAQIEYANVYFSSMTGYSFDEIVGKNAVLLLSADNPQFVLDEMKSTLRSGQTWKGELMNRRKDGSQYWSEIVIAPILSPQNEIKNYISTLTDFTEKIVTQTELEDLCTQLQINEEKALKLNQELSKQKEEIQENRDEQSRQKEQLQKQNDKLLKQQKSITASLEYALRIQQAMMAQQSELKDLFPESFLFYLPRDFISGDFYWYRQLDEHRSIIAAVDCTGHGIPGAFMSMLGSSLLSQIIEQNKIYEPEVILDQLDTGIVRALNQNITNNCDGMEVSLVLVDKKKQQIQFAGAGLPLAYLKDGVLKIIKGSKRPIGGLQVPNLHKQSYTTHTLPLEAGTSYYLFSDGYADQFDKTGERKFLVKNFRELLSSMNEIPMEEQFGILFDTLISWKGKQKQTDDILVLGFKV